MFNYQVMFTHSIKRVGESSYVGQTKNEGTIIVQAQSARHAEEMVRAMYGGHQNVQIRSVIQKY